ncbi:MAG: Na+-transporting methylmalonyl-CoA/oxaloacetate decarboxylase beta subunit, partial [Candidatus Binatia bacterium]
MEILQQLINSAGFMHLGWQNFVMFAVGGTLIFLAVKYNFEPLLLIPIGFGAIL